jgi:hypothetical protein
MISGTNLWTFSDSQFFGEWEHDLVVSAAPHQYLISARPVFSKPHLCGQGEGLGKDLQQSVVSLVPESRAGDSHKLNGSRHATQSRPGPSYG